MDLIKNYSKMTKINTDSAFSVFSTLFEFSEVKSEYKSIKTIKKKEDINNYLLGFLEKVLQQDFIKDKAKKLELIKLVDQLNFRNEVLESFKSNIPKKALMTISKRLNSKTMSSFDNY